MKVVSVCLLAGLILLSAPASGQLSGQSTQNTQKGKQGVSRPTLQEVQDLPLQVVTNQGAAFTQRMAFFVTGDGGWGVTDQGICQGLAGGGIPTVALNSMKYFWKRRTPEETSWDLARVLRCYLAVWGRSRVVLVGYSMGADVLPFMASRLPRDLQDRIDLIVLLNPSRSVDFEFHITEWIFSSHRKTDLPVLPELEKLRGKRILCFYGEDEDDSLAKGLDPALAHAVPLRGGHRVKNNYGPVLDGIWRELSH